MRAARGLIGSFLGVAAELPICLWKAQLTLHRMKLGGKEGGNQNPKPAPGSLALVQDFMNTINHSRGQPVGRRGGGYRQEVLSQMTDAAEQRNTTSLVTG